MKKVTIIGLGWFGMALGQSMVDHWEVIGTKTQGRQSSAGKITVYPMALTPEPRSEYLDRIFDADAVVLNIPPSMNGMAEDYSAAMSSLLVLLKNSRVDHLVFVSSTSVFGSEQNRVDEDSSPRPDTRNGRVLRDAEILFMENFPGQCSIVRPAGLVGADRHPVKHLSGRSMVKGQNHPVNSVHRSDLILLVKEVVDRPVERQVFHAVADKHPTKAEFYTRMAERMGLEPPEFDKTDLSTGKTINGRKSKEAMGIRFKFDDPFDMV